MSTVTIEMLVARVEVLEKQIASLTTTDQTPKKSIKKDKKNTKSDDSDAEQPAKKTRVSGYILFGKAIRDDVKAELFTDGEKVKSSLVMAELGKRWKALNDDERDAWNAKAQELKTAD